MRLLCGTLRWHEVTGSDLCQYDILSPSMVQMQDLLVCLAADPVARCQQSATFLPEVAKHERWSCQETIDALIAKAGYVGVVIDQLRDSLVITRYQSTACSLSYDEYCSLRQPLAGPVPSANGLPITVPA